MRLSVSKVYETKTGSRNSGAIRTVGAPGRYAHIDAMRALAVMLVVFAHGGLGAIVPGGSGVTIFFSISGFIITFLLLRERDKTGGFRIGDFYFRRAVKIFPPLIIAIVIPTIIYGLVNSVDWLAASAQVLFFYNWYKMAGGAEVLPGTGVVWSLSIEEQFYIVFALIWIACVRFRYWRQVLTALAIMAIAFSSVMRILLAVGNAPTERIYYGSDTRLDGIAWGVLTAIAFHKWMANGSVENRWTRLAGSAGAPVLAGALYLASLLIRDEFFRDTARYSLQSIAACIVIVYGFMQGSNVIRSGFNKMVGSGVVSLIGLASYSIYLVHLVLMLQISPLLESWPDWLSLTFLATIGVSAGVLLYKWVEVPVHNWRIRRRTG